jgi:Carboxypeptidase regulatory-like domain
MTSRVSKSMALGFLILPLLFAAGNLTFAQTTGSGTINGTVRDPAQAAIPGASVTIHNLDTGIDRAVSTNEAGLYSAPFLSPGRYEITVTKAGFTMVTRKELTLQVGQTLTIDLELPVQGREETVTVTGEAPVVDTEKT